MTVISIVESRMFTRVVIDSADRADLCAYASAPIFHVPTSYVVGPTQHSLLVTRGSKQS